MRRYTSLLYGMQTMCICVAINDRMKAGDVQYPSDSNSFINCLTPSFFSRDLNIYILLFQKHVRISKISQIEKCNKKPQIKRQKHPQLTQWNIQPKKTPYTCSSESKKNPSCILHPKSRDRPSVTTVFPVPSKQKPDYLPNAQSHPPASQQDSPPNCPH